MRKSCGEGLITKEHICSNAYKFKLTLYYSILVSDIIMFHQISYRQIYSKLSVEKPTIDYNSEINVQLIFNHHYKQ